MSNMQDFSLFDQLENLRFYGFAIEGMFDKIIADPHHTVDDLNALKQKFMTFTQQWEMLFESISEWTENKLMQKHNKIKIQLEKRKLDRERLHQQKKQLIRSSNVAKSQEQSFNKSLNTISNLWNRGLGKMEVALNEQKQNRLRVESAHMRQLRKAEEEMHDVLNTSMPHNKKKLKVISDTESDLHDSSFDYEDLRSSSRRFTSGMQGMKLSLNLSKSKPVPPSQPSSRQTFLRSAHRGGAGQYTNRSSMDFDRDMMLSDRSNISDLFNQIIDEEMAKNSAITERSGISIKKLHSGWNSEYESEIEPEKPHIITKEALQAALLKYNDGKQSSRREQLMDDCQRSANLELMMQIKSLKSTGKREGPHIMTPRDSRSFNAPLNTNPSKPESPKHCRIPTDEAIEAVDEVDELAVTSPRNALFLPLRLEELESIRK